LASIYSCFRFSDISLFSTQLEQDLIQKEFQTILGDESCEAVNAGLEYYENGGGKLLKDLPNYTTTQGSVWKLYEEYYGSKDFCDKWVTAALKGGKFNFNGGEVNFGNFPGNLGDPEDEDGECVGREGE
jgi:hypothetical protein